MALDAGPDADLFARLVPVNGLSRASRRQLLEKAEVLELAPGEELFRRGDRDGRTVYLVEGEVELEGSGERVLVRAGTATANHPLAQHQPRQVTARARTAVRVLAFETALLDMLLTWDQSPNKQYEVEEIVTGGDDEWITRMLQNRVFLKLPPANIQQIIMRMEDVRVRAGDVVVRQDEEGDYYYYIRAGRAEVVRRPSPEAPEVRLAELGEGDGFGEEALVADGRRNASVRMLTDGHLMRLAKKDFVQLIRDPLRNAVDYYKAEALVSEGAVWLDVRLPDEHANAHIADSINIPLPALRLQLGRLDRNRPYVVYCDTGRRSAVAAFLLNEKGYEAYVLAGGLMQLPPEVFLSGSGGGEAPGLVASHEAGEEPPEAPPPEPAPTGEALDRIREEAERVLAEARERAEAVLRESEAARRRAEEESQRLLAEARRAMEEVRAERERAREEAERLARLEAELEKERERLRAETDQGREREEALAASRAELERLRRSHDEMEARWLASQQELARLEEELARVREARDAAEAGADRVRRDAEETRRRGEEALTGLRTELESVRAEAERSREEAVRLREELDTLRARLDESEAERRRLEQEAAGVGEGRVAELERALGEAEERVAAAGRRAEEAERRQHELEEEVRRLGAELAAATERIHELEVEKEELWRARKEAEQEVAQARREAVEVIQRAHEEAEALKRELRVARAEAEEEIRRRLEVETNRLQAQFRSQAVMARAGAGRPRRRVLPWVLLAAVLLGGGGAGFWAWRQGWIALPGRAPSPPVGTSALPAEEPAPQAAAVTSKPRAASAPRPGTRGARPSSAPFRDRLRSGGLGPEMVPLAGGSFVMGSGDDQPYVNERPAHEVRLAPFAIGRYEVTFEEYDRFARATGRPLPDDEGWGRGRRPVVNVSWEDAVAYAEWLSAETGRLYRLPSEAQWEYAARGGAPGIYWWGNFIGVGNANCFNCSNPFDGRQTAPVGAFPANPFGLYDTAGNVAEWVQDCYHPSYEGAPTDGRPWEEAGCGERVVRGGSFSSAAKNLRVTVRERFAPDTRLENLGFRLVRLR